MYCNPIDCIIERECVIRIKYPFDSSEFDPRLLHEYRFNSYSLTEVAEVISALPFWRFSDKFDSTERRHTGVHIGMLCAQPEVCMPDRYRLRPQSPFLKDVLSDFTGVNIFTL